MNWEKYKIHACLRKCDFNLLLKYAIMKEAFLSGFIKQHISHRELYMRRLFQKSWKLHSKSAANLYIIINITPLNYCTCNRGYIFNYFTLFNTG